MKRLRNLMKRLLGETSGVAMTEFAMAMPVMLTAGLWGVETANFAITNMRVSQLAQQVADNASRIGDTSTLEERKIYEADFMDLLLGAHIQGGQRLDLFDRGRVIISSLEVFEEARHCDEAGVCVLNADDGTQFIHYQRCMGVKNYTPQYGNSGDLKPTGMGRSGEEVSALEGSPVMFVEVAYDYQPLVAKAFIPSSTTIRSIASFMVRDDRDVLKVYQRDPGNPDPVADCAVFDNPNPDTAGGGSGGGGSTSSSGGASSGGASSGGASSGGASSGGGGASSGGSGSSSSSGGGSGSSSSSGGGSSTTTSSGGGGSTTTTTTTSSGGGSSSSSSSSGGGGGASSGGGGGGASSGGASSGGKKT